MKSIQKIKNSVLTLFFIFSISFIGNSQNIQDITFSTHYKAFDAQNQFPIISFSLDELDDSTLSLSFHSGDSNNLAGERNVYLIDKQNMLVVDTINIWQRNGRFIAKNSRGEYGTSSIVIENRASNQKYFFESDYLITGNLQFRFYTLKNEFEKDSLWLSKTFTNRSLFMFPFIQDSVFTLLSGNLNGGAPSDTGFIENYNFQGNLIQQRIIDNNNFDLSKDFDFQFFSNPNPHPINNSLFTIERRNARPTVVSLNRQTLATNSIIGFSQSIMAYLANTYQYAGADASFYIIDSTGFETGGAAIKYDFSNNTFDDQFFYTRIAWDSTLISYQTFGNTINNELGSGFYRENNKRYLVGCSPRNVFYNYGVENRQILLFQISPNRVDSIFIYGNKNHYPGKVIADNNGDIYVVSTFSNFASDDSIYLQLTKIPQSILSSIHEQELSRKIHLYPNPTRDILNSEDFKHGDLIRIYNVKGQTIHEQKIDREGMIDINSLENGTYFLQLIHENSTFKSIVFIKSN